MAEAASQFVAFDPDALLSLAKQGDIEAITVLFALCKHANPCGGCNPGKTRLAALSGHRVDRIRGILQRLHDADYIHIIETPVPYLPQPLLGFLINPDFLHLAPRFYDSAKADWARLHFSNMIRVGVITHGENDRQPDQIKNQNQELALKPETQPAPPNQIQPSASGADHSQERLEGEGQKPMPEQGAARTELESPAVGRAMPPSAPPPMLLPLWEPKTLQQYKHSLADENNENVALDLVSLAGDMSRENARMLVDTYGWEWVTWIMGLYRKESYSVEHPARWMRSMLRKTTTELSQRES